MKSFGVFTFYSFSDYCSDGIMSSYDYGVSID